MKEHDTPIPSAPRQEEGPTFHWWPPEFLEPQAEEAQPEDAAPAPDEEELQQRLARSYQLIDRQREDIRSLTAQLDELEEAADTARRNLRRARARRRTAVKAGIGLTALAGTLVFYREVSQVGWNALQWMAGALGLTAQTAAGLLAAGAAARLFWALAKATFHAACEELFGPEEELE